MRTFTSSLSVGVVAVSGWLSVVVLAEPATAPAVETVEVVKGDLELKVTVGGWFEPIDPMEVRFRPRAFSGELKVDQVAPHGGMVKAGEPVLRLNADEINRQIASAENELALASANLAKAEADLKLGTEADSLAAKVQLESLAAAEEAVAWWEKVDGPNMQKQYEMQLRGSKHNVEDQQDELDQLKKMYKSEELTNQTADIVVKRALRQLEFSKIGLEMTEKRVEKSKATDYESSKRAVLNAREQQKQASAALAALQAQGQVQRQAALVSARSAHDSAYRKLNDLRTDAAAMSVTASSDGIVLYGRLVNGSWQGGSEGTLGTGDKVAPEQVVVTVVQPGRVRFVAAVPEQQVARIRVGDPVILSPRAMPEKQITGRSGSLPPVATTTTEGQKFAVPVEIEAAEAMLLPGYSGDAEIDVADAAGVLLIPRTAVANGSVMVDVNGQRTRRSVTLGRTDGERVEVTRGLHVGERVLKNYQE